MTDLRLWLGIALVVVSMVVGARIVGADDGVPVLRATRDLAAGMAPEDLELVRVPANAAAAYLTSVPDGVLLRPVHAGELVPAAAVAPAPSEPTRAVAIPVDTLHLPPAAGVGDRVDVWATSPEGSSTPHLVLAAATIADIGADETGIAGRVVVVLDVPQEHVADVVSSARSGVVDLTAVPVDEVASGAPVIAAGP